MIFYFFQTHKTGDLGVVGLTVSFMELLGGPELFSCAAPAEVVMVSCDRARIFVVRTAIANGSACSRSKYTAYGTGGVDPSGQNQRPRRKLSRNWWLSSVTTTNAVRLSFLASVRALNHAITTRSAMNVTAWPNGRDFVRKTDKNVHVRMRSERHVRHNAEHYLQMSRCLETVCFGRDKVVNVQAARKATRNDALHEELLVPDDPLVIAVRTGDWQRVRMIDRLGAAQVNAPAAEGDGRVRAAIDNDAHHAVAGAEGSIMTTCRETLNH